MKKIGILTHYYNSYNYGGVLQSYALCAYLNNCGYISEQICYALKKDSKNTSTKNKLKKYLSRIILKKRIKLFNSFRETIPHSYDVYNDITLDLLNDKYDVFIVGSDQVWNPDYFHKGFFLEFANDDKIKISYAASISKTNIDERFIDYYKKIVSRFDYISVREKNAKEILSKIIAKDIRVVLDPVYLISKKDWEEISEPRIILNDYIFYYELSYNPNNREKVIKFAKIKGLKVVFIPHAKLSVSKYDFKFGDFSLKNIGPKEFLSLIRYSSYVFTDSFHACVFSTIFEKEFFVFERTMLPEMNTRIIDILRLFKCENHFLGKSAGEITSIEPIQYNSNCMEQAIRKSKEYLNSCF